MQSKKINKPFDFEVLLTAEEYGICCAALETITELLQKTSSNKEDSEDFKKVIALRDCFDRGLTK